MRETDRASGGWFVDVDPENLSAAADRVRDGKADTPQAWPRIAVERRFVDDQASYYDRLHAASVEAARREVERRELADDQQVIHAIRAIDDLASVSNELAERVVEWAGTTALPDDAGREQVAKLGTVDASTPTEARIVSLSRVVAGMNEEREALITYVEETMQSLAPNLTAMAGPLLGARLIALAGGLESLAKMSSSTIQVLGAEDALFAHLRGGATSPKHGIIFTHEYVRGTQPADRGSAARAVAGKLAIAARVDYYSGERKPEIEHQLDERIARIQEREA